MTIIIILLAFGAGAFLVFEQLSSRRVAVAEQLQRVQADTPARTGTERRWGLTATNVSDELARLAARLQPGASHEKLRRRLHMAGLRSTPQRFLAAKAAISIAPLVLTAISALGGNSRALVFGPLLALVLFMLPDSYLTMRQRARRQAIDLGLPDTLDLLTVSVEAGLGFDSAVQKVTERLDGPLIDEFVIMLHEMRLGASRRHAMDNLAARTGSDEVASFTRSLLQSDELGVPIGAALRVQADEMRVRRQLRAEEQATKAPVKLLFPTVAFIFPVIFLIVVAPAVMNIMEMLSGA